MHACLSGVVAGKNCVCCGVGGGKGIKVAGGGGGGGQAWGQNKPQVPVWGLGTRNQPDPTHPPCLGWAIGKNKFMSLSNLSVQTENWEGRWRVCMVHLGVCCCLACPANLAQNKLNQTSRKNCLFVGGWQVEGEVQS